MIQRVQTLFLLAIAILSALMIFLPFETVIVKSTEPGVVMGTYELCLSPACIREGVSGFIHVPMVLNVVILILSLVTVFMYRNRRRQIKLSQLLMVLSALLIGSLFVMPLVKGDAAMLDIEYKIASFFPAINAICAFLARTFIKKDEELVRSADRIR
jgi:hypothetical protein